jgi:hypothetical protein
MTGTLTGHMYGKLINGTYLELIIGSWLSMTEVESEDAGFSSNINGRPSWV